MKKIFAFILAILPCGYLFAQIGINIEKPQGVFHVSGDINTPTDTSDDIIVTDDGNLGIGLLNPTNKLEVKGTTIFRDKVTVNNGTQGNLKAFGSDKDGFGTWSFLQALKKVQIKYTLKTGQTNTHTTAEQLYMMDGNTSVATSGDLTDVNFTLKSFTSNEGAVTNGFSLKKGQYLFMVSSNIAPDQHAQLSAEYGALRVKSKNSTGTTELFNTYYMLSVNGSYFYVDAKEDDQFYITYEAVDPQVKDASGNSFFLSPPYTTQNDKAELFIIYLKDRENL